jgi:hypothetical protein
LTARCIATAGVTRRRQDGAERDATDDVVRDSGGSVVATMNFHWQ